MDHNNAFRRMTAAAFNCQLRNRVAAMSREDLINQLYRDPLTGTYNRRAFAEADSEWLAIVDCDSLKWVNDNHGHLAGDAMLCELAGALVAEFGETAVFRLGGDEFVVRSDCRANLSAGLMAVQAERFAGFSAGVGCALADADTALMVDKNHREACGARAGRGEVPAMLEGAAATA